MKLPVIGGGGREHAIIRALKKNPNADVIYTLPGNGGMPANAVCVPDRYDMQLFTSAVKYFRG